MSKYKDSNEPKKYFDLHTTGFGYANRMREVKMRGQGFWAVDISALRGNSDDAQYTKFDTRISGREALEVLTRFKADIDAKKKVLVGFRIGDIYPETFIFEKGEKAGQTGVVLKGRLLQVAWVKVDGKMLYTAKENDQAADALAKAA